MRILLSIGYHHILLPDERNIDTLLKVLGSGMSVEDQLYNGKLIINKDDVKIEFRTVPSNTKYVNAESPEAETRDPFTARQVKAITSAPNRLLLNG